MTKIIEIKNALSKKYYEREREIEGLLIAMLSKQHILFIGDAGTGKSMLSAELGRAVTGSSYFQWLLSQFTTPEELFGVLSLKELEQGVYRRNTAGKLPEAHFAFLDEIFKSTSAILNSLLTLINERLFYNNGCPVQAPLMTIVGSSNEYPEEDEGLEALFDRFLLRYEVDYIKEVNSFISLLKGDNHVQIPSISLAELQQYQFEVSQVTIPENVIETLAEIRQALKDEGIRPSDRRFVQSLSLLKARAFINGRSDVILRDIELLKNSLWEKPEQQGTVAEIVRDYSIDQNEQAFEQRLQEVTELVSLLKQDGKDVNDKLEVMNKLKTIKKDIEGLALDDTVRKATLIENITNEMNEFVSKIIDF